jgi:ubiquinone/menaquinone biosynthesis C-methylase UbiE
MIPDNWKPSLKSFFDTRAHEVGSPPTLRELCFIAGREPRLWSDQELYQDMIDSIIDLCAIDERSSVLEVGCAAGFLSLGVAPRVKQYHGVDLAVGALKVARRLRLPNAKFSVADGGSLQFRSNCFDAAFCYDVFTNFPDFSFGSPLIGEMFRVVRPGGKVVVGSVPDRAVQQQFEERVQIVMRELDARHGRAGPDPRRKTSPLMRLRRRFAWTHQKESSQPAILCYYFDRVDFVELARKLGASVTVTDIHRKNPYCGFRFNVVYGKPQST